MLNWKWGSQGKALLPREKVIEASTTFGVKIELVITVGHRHGTRTDGHSCLRLLYWRGQKQKGLHALSLLDGAPTKRPKTKRPRPKTSQVQNVPLHKVPPIKRPSYKTSQPRNVPSPKTSQLQNVPTPKRPKLQNVPSHKTSQP
jgi:hypothetical protein